MESRRSECFRSSSAQRTQGEDTAEQGMSKTPTGQDGVQAQRVLQVFIHKEGLGHGGGVRQPGGLNQNVVKPAQMWTRLIKRMGYRIKFASAGGGGVRQPGGLNQDVVKREWDGRAGMALLSWEAVPVKQMAFCCASNGRVRGADCGTLDGSDCRMCSTDGATAAPFLTCSCASAAW